MYTLYYVHVHVPSDYFAKFTSCSHWQEFYHTIFFRLRRGYDDLYHIGKIFMYMYAVIVTLRCAGELLDLQSGQSLLTSSTAI